MTRLRGPTIDKGDVDSKVSAAGRDHKTEAEARADQVK